ncbi:hypothetical protein [Bacillus suaedaesalsae]|uniref:Uncharacterized protein n=1 Tax=Bacillus suaedaesalsae TaxID=2810349 RepID=A0ABS2DHE7_9BACI|nr:hypothetical protein [Bacillus suaedaesalsae]MBM6617851.1 hypothetical protein [Bacillus suaedaesalsae]
MKKIIAIIVVMIILVIGSMWGYNFIGHEGKFTNTMHSSIVQEKLEDEIVFYIGFRFVWEGIGSPTLENVE